MQNKEVIDLPEITQPADDDLLLIYQASSFTSKKVKIVSINNATQTLRNKTIIAPAGIVKADVGLGNVDNTSDATKNSASATLTNKTLSSGCVIDVNVVVTEVLKKVYPVGSYYVNETDSTNPATLFGFGTWVAVSDKVVVGRNPTSGTFNVAGGTTGGEETHVLSEAEMPLHKHRISVGAGGAGVLEWTDPDLTATTRTYTASSGVVSTRQAGYTETKGSGTAHNNLQPYIVAYMWKRTA